jgi:hypothetical protein
MKRIWIGICLLLLIVVSCGDREKMIQELALQELDLKIKTHTHKKQSECGAQAIEEAEMIVDSIIRYSYFSPINKDNYNPTIPPKPAFIPVDSSVFKSENSVKPIKETN